MICHTHGRVNFLLLFYYASLGAALSTSYLCFANVPAASLINVSGIACYKDDALFLFVKQAAPIKNIYDREVERRFNHYNYALSRELHGRARRNMAFPIERTVWSMASERGKK